MMNFFIHSFVKRMSLIFVFLLSVGLQWQIVSPVRAEDAPAMTSEQNDSVDAEQKATFDIMEFNVVGNTVLPTTVIEKAVYPFLGVKKTIDDAEAARTALEQAYHDAGYLTVLVNIPEQKVGAGVVNLEVIEATVDRLRVTGAKYYSLGEIKTHVPELDEGKVPHFPTMQKQINALNRTPDRKVTPVLKAGNTPGTLQVELKVEDELPLHGSLSLNDRYSADTVRWRSSANVKYDNLWQLGHSLSASVTVAPEDVNQVQVYALTYAVPLESGDYLAFYGVKSNTNVAAVGTLNVIGSGVIFGSRYIHPLPALDNLYHTLTIGLDYKDFDQTIALQDIPDVINKPISYMPVTAGWDGVWYSKMSTTKLGLSLNANIRGLAGDSDGDFSNKRTSGKSNFAFLRTSYEYDWHLQNDMRIDFRLTGQLADQALVANEQFAIGGVDTVRGYLESEVLGDKGYAMSAEIHMPSLAKYLKLPAKDLHLFAFGDMGEAVVIDPTPLQTGHRFLASLGLGLRYNVDKWTFKLDVADPLEEGARTKSGDTRAHVSLDYTF